MVPVPEIMDARFLLAIFAWFLLGKTCNALVVQRVSFDFSLGGHGCARNKGRHVHFGSGRIGVSRP